MAAPEEGEAAFDFEKFKSSTVTPFLNSSKLILPAPAWSSSFFGAEIMSFTGSLASADLAELPRLPT